MLYDQHCTIWLNFSQLNFPKNASKFWFISFFLFQRKAVLKYISMREALLGVLMRAKAQKTFYSDLQIEKYLWIYVLADFGDHPEIDQITRSDDWMILHDFQKIKERYPDYAVVKLVKELSERHKSEP